MGQAFLMEWSPLLNSIKSAKVGVLSSTEKEATNMNITTIGIDLAKNVFQVHGVDERVREA